MRLRTAARLVLAIVTVLSADIPGALAQVSEPDFPPPPSAPPPAPAPLPVPVPGPVVPPAIVPPTGPFFPPPVIFPGDTAQAAVRITQRARPESTAGIVSSLALATAFCGRIQQEEYRIDCLAERIDEVAGMIPTSGDYAEARAALGRAADRLSALARRNASPTLPRGTARGQTSGTVSNRPLVPVRTDALPALAERAVEIIEETETLLLRSAESSQRRRTHYEAIAAAVGSNKVLLRS